MREVEITVKSKKRAARGCQEGHVGSLSEPGLEQTKHLEGTQGLPYRPTAYPQLASELTLGWESGLWTELPSSDHVQDLLGDDRVCSLGLYSMERYGQLCGGVFQASTLLVSGSPREWRRTD